MTRECPGQNLPAIFQGFLPGLKMITLDADSLAARQPVRLYNRFPDLEQKLLDAVHGSENPVTRVAWYVVLS